MKTQLELASTKPVGGQTKRRSLHILLTLATVTAFGAACSSGSPTVPAASIDSSVSSSSAEDSKNDFEFDAPVIASAGRIYTIDDMVNAGWKKSKELPKDPLQGVIEAWSGFYQQKNLEVRIYESHGEALRLGPASAEEIVARSQEVSRGATDPPQYAGYGVLGNLVVLCEFDVAVCADLAASLK